MRVLLILLLILAVAAGAYTTLFKVDEGEFGVVSGMEEADVIAVLHPGYNFVPRALFPWKVSVAYRRTRSTEMADVSVPLPGLEELDNRHYCVGLKVNLSYELDFEAVPGELLAEKGQVRKMFERLLKGAFTREIKTYLYPYYDQRKLEREFEAVAEKAFESVKKQCASSGIKVLGQEVIGSVSIPGEEIFREGTALAADLRRIENENRKELLVLENNLQKDDYRNKKYLENLREIAKLVKNNPDLLKYLYIKGFSKNVKAIIASERTGMPFGLDFEGAGASSAKKGDVDNLK
ncbi:MAG TPA: hypothetical protein PKY31_12560 [Spirochaetota bacterium]|nr:hypothetical protein [Spirochaetota bacterium]